MWDDEILEKHFTPETRAEWEEFTRNYKTTLTQLAIESFVKQKKVERTQCDSQGSDSEEYDEEPQRGKKRRTIVDTEALLERIANGEFKGFQSQNACKLANVIVRTPLIIATQGKAKSIELLEDTTPDMSNAEIPAYGISLKEVVTKVTLILRHIDMLNCKIGRILIAEPYFKKLLDAEQWQSFKFNCESLNYQMGNKNWSAHEEKMQQKDSKFEKRGIHRNFFNSKGKGKGKGWQSRNFGKPRRAQCFVCGDESHYAKDCPKANRPKRSDEAL